MLRSAPHRARHTGHSASVPGMLRVLGGSQELSPTAITSCPSPPPAGLAQQQAESRSRAPNAASQGEAACAKRLQAQPASPSEPLPPCRPRLMHGRSPGRSR